MVVYTTTHPLAGPLVLLIWLLDSYIALAAIRMALSWIDADWARQACARLAQATDPIPNAISRALSRRAKSPLRGWASWLIFLFVIVLVRQIMAWAILHLG